MSTMIERLRAYIRAAAAAVVAPAPVPDRMQLASLVYVSVSMLANCIFPTHHRIHIGQLL